jgi:hypothetical protein
MTSVLSETGERYDMSPAHRPVNDDDGDTAPLPRVHRGHIGLGIVVDVDVPGGCPIDGIVNAYGEFDFSFGTATTGVHLSFEPQALQQFVALARYLLGRGSA